MKIKESNPKADTTDGVASSEADANNEKFSSQELEVAGPPAPIDPDFSPEIIVALCGAAGTDLSNVCRAVAKEFSAFGYKAETIVLSDIFSNLAAFSDIKSEKFEDLRIEAAMNAGNKVRSLIENPDAAARLAIAEIRSRREKASGSPDQPLPKTVYIIKSIKTTGEYNLLSKLYKDAFFMISVYESRHERVSNLRKRIAKSRKQRPEEADNAAEKLIDRDEDEAGNDLGQGVRDAFQLGDVFIEVGKQLNKQLRRIVELAFGAPYITPTRQEHGMFHAYAASLKSADLSRQVGAVVITNDGEIIASGCNEVPKVGGGAIWEEDIDDNAKERRDFGLGYDSTALMKREILTEVVKALKGQWFKDDVAVRSDESLVDEMLRKDSRVSLREARISNIIEFGRIVHAEMAALMDAARRGVAVRDHALYCTTFPCHMCARHIVAAGVNTVVYIEPYPKSLAKKLYEHEILVDNELASGRNGVRFTPFVGVAPKRYVSWFRAGKRKDAEGWALPARGSVEARKVALTVWSPPDEEVVYEDSLRVLEELDAKREGADESIQ